MRGGTLKEVLNSHGVTAAIESLLTSRTSFYRASPRSGKFDFADLYTCHL